MILLSLSHSLCDLVFLVPTIEGRTNSKMSKTLICIQLSRTLIILLTSIFIVLSITQMLHFAIIPWPIYHSIVVILLDLVLVIGLIASLIQHLQTLIFFSWLIALTFLLTFFGNTVSSQYQSDLIGEYQMAHPSAQSGTRTVVVAAACKGHSS